MGANDDGIAVRAKRYRRMKKKKENPHKLRIVFKREITANVEMFGCSRAAVQSLCHHVIG